MWLSQLLIAMSTRGDTKRVKLTPTTPYPNFVLCIKDATDGSKHYFVGSMDVVYDGGEPRGRVFELPNAAIENDPNEVNWKDVICQMGDGEPIRAENNYIDIFYRLPSLRSKIVTVKMNGTIDDFLNTAESVLGQHNEANLMKNLGEVNAIENKERIEYTDTPSIDDAYRSVRVRIRNEKGGPDRILCMRGGTTRVNAVWDPAHPLYTAVQDMYDANCKDFINDIKENKLVRYKTSARYKNLDERWKRVVDRMVRVDKQKVTVTEFIPSIHITYFYEDTSEDGDYANNEYNDLELGEEFDCEITLSVGIFYVLESTHASMMDGAVVSLLEPYVFKMIAMDQFVPNGPQLTRFVQENGVIENVNNGRVLERVTFTLH